MGVNIMDIPGMVSRDDELAQSTLCTQLYKRIKILFQDIFFLKIM